MSPERSACHVSPDPPKGKPYLKSPTPVPMEEITNTLAQRSPVLTPQPEFPSRAQYLQIEDAYINSLHPRRQSKALISRDLFERVWDVLARNPDYSPETAQFRFWARRKFTLGSLGDTPIKDDHSGSTSPPPNAILIHHNRIVAIREDIYDIIREKHAASNHGGRDRTATAIREHYIWIPKELVANFVKLCPTCIRKKCGIPNSRKKAHKGHEHGENVDTNSPKLRYCPSPTGNTQNNGYSPTLASSPLFNAFSSPVLGSSEDGRVVTHSPSPGSPLLNEEPSPSPLYSSFTLLREHNWSAPAEMAYSRAGPPIPVPLRRVDNHSAPAPGSSSMGSGLQSLPMSREVSLYQGLPNGWQFQHKDYPAAHDAFIKPEEEEDLISMHPPEPIPLPSGRRYRPRIPSLAPIVATLSQEEDESICYVKEEPSEDFQQHLGFPPLDYSDGISTIALPLPIPHEQVLLQLSVDAAATNADLRTSSRSHILNPFLRFGDNVYNSSSRPPTACDPSLTLNLLPLPGSLDLDELTPTCHVQSTFPDGMMTQSEAADAEIDDLAKKMRASTSLEEASNEVQ